MQAYLAAAQAAEGVVAEAGLDEKDAERVGFVLTNMIDALAPSNNPLLNPAAVKAAVDSGGKSALSKNPANSDEDVPAVAGSGRSERIGTRAGTLGGWRSERPPGPRSRRRRLGAVGAGGRGWRAAPRRSRRRRSPRRTSHGRAGPCA